MADNTRQASLQLSVSTTGTQQVAALASQFDQLAKQGGALAPEFEAMAAQLRAVGDQDALVAELGKIEGVLATTSVELDAAKISAASLGQTYQQQTLTVEGFRNAQAELQQTIASLSAGLAESRGNLQILNAQTDAAGRTTDSYKQTVQALRTEIADQSVALGQQKTALQDVTAQANAAQRSLDQLGQQYFAADAAVSALDATLASQREALAAVTTTLQEAGVSTESFAAAQAQVGAALADVRASAGALVAENDQLTDAQQRATAAAAADSAEQQRLNIVYQEQQALYTSLFEEVVARANAANELAASLARETAAQEQANLAAQEAVSGAFGALGIRSLEEIQAEVTQVERSLVLLADGYQNGTVSAGSFTRATAAAQVQLAALVEETQTLPQLPSLFQNIASSANELISSFAGLAATIGILTLAVKPVIDLAIQVDALNRALTTITGSSAEAAAQMQFLADTANHSGLSVGSLSDSFVQFTASLRTAGFSAQDTEQIFGAVANAAGNLGLSSEKSSSVLLALSQIANKGVVSMEELRRQLGEALPGALNLLAQGLGITVAQLDKLVTSGQLTAQQALIPLANAMVELGSKGKDVEGLGASFNRLENAVRQALLSITQSEPFKALGASIDFVTNNFGALTTAVKVLGEAFVLGKLSDAVSAFSGIGSATVTATTAIVAHTAAEVENNTVTTANTAARVANTTASIAAAEANAALSASTRIVTTAGLAAGNAISGLAQAPSLIGRIGSGALALAGGPVGALALFALNAKDLGTFIGDTAAKWAGYEDILKKGEQTLKDNADNAAFNQKAQQELAAQIVRGTIAYNDQQSSIANQIVASKKLVEASKLQADAIIQIAALSGSEAEQRQAAVVATNGNEVAVQKLVDARRIEVDLLKTHIDSVTRDATASGTLDAALKKQLSTQSDALVKQQAALAESEAQLAAFHAQALAAQAASQAYQDNSGRLDQLRDAYQSAATAAALNKQANVDGLVTLEAVIRSSQAAAAAENLYRDAINDQIGAAQRQVAGANLYVSTVGQTSQSVQIASAAATNYSDKVNLLTTALQDQVAALKLSQAQVTAEIAAHGDPTGVRTKELADLQNLIDLKTQDVQKSVQSAQAAKDEAAAKQLTAQAYLDNSSRLGQYQANLNAANAELARQIDLQRQGKATSDDVATALRGAATAQALYNDAVKDTIANLQAQATLDKSRNTQLSANIDLAKAQASAQEAAARAAGDEVGVTRAQIAGKQDEIAARLQTAAAMRQEADASIAVAQQEEAAERQAGTLTAAKQKEYDARINNANAQKIEADATEAAIPGINAEINALNQLTTATTGSSTATTKAAAAQADRTVGVSATNTAPTDIAFSIQQKLQKGALTAADLADAQTAVQQAITASQLSTAFQKAGVAGLGNDGSGTLLTNARDALAQVQNLVAIQNKQQAGGTTAGAAGAAAVTAAGAAPAQSTTHNVNITLNGQTTSIGAASAADAASLTSLLTQLANAANRTTG
jgi:tape measure domain-containing protein